MTTPIQPILLVRHDASLANVDPRVYVTMPDHVIPLAENDSPRVRIAADHVRALDLDPRTTCSWCSPYVRCRQTEESVLRLAFGDGAERIVRRESFLLRKQDFGDWDSFGA